MAILQGLPEEITAHPELVGASREIIINTLNTMPGSGGTYVVMTDLLKIPKGDILALLSFESQVKLYDWIKAESDYAKGFSLFFYAHDQFKVSDPVFRGTISLLNNPLNLITEPERDAILRLGERLQTRSEELWGRLITEGDFE